MTSVRTQRESTDRPGTRLHADDGVDEEDHGDEQADVGQGLEGLDEGPEERPNAFSFTEQLNQPQHSEQTKEGDGHLSAFPFASALNST